ncbi:hypothetical protein V6N11_055102 [Hibiscus sabdariffa]|uniref:Uncharacterized protein n=1 Tax=Hibiscus sabdariffa TaxID=183260 RepID=A0ABR1ZPY9_9ROSI
MPDRSLLSAFDAFPAYDISLLAPCFSKAFARLLEPHHVIAFCDDGDGVGAASGSGQPAGSESPRSLTASEQSYLREILGEDQGGIRDLDQAAIRSDLKRKDQSYGSDLASSYKQPPPRQASKGHMRAQRTSKRALDLTTGAMEQVVLV